MLPNRSQTYSESSSGTVENLCPFFIHGRLNASYAHVCDCVRRTFVCCSTRCSVARRGKSGACCRRSAIGGPRPLPLPSIPARFAPMSGFFRSICWKAAALGGAVQSLPPSTIATQFALEGLEPAGDNGTYFQRVPLMAVHTVEDKTRFAFVPAGGAPVDLAYGTQIVSKDQDRRRHCRYRCSHCFCGIRHSRARVPQG